MKQEEEKKSNPIQNQWIDRGVNEMIKLQFNTHTHTLNIAENIEKRKTSNKPATLNVERLNIALLKCLG